MDVGRYHDAIQEFNISIQHGGGIVAENGRATAFKHAGRVQEALDEYDRILSDLPYNTATLCGRAEVFRAKDDPVAALDAYKLAVERAPHAPRTWAGLAHAYEDLGRFDEAREVYRIAKGRFHEDEFIAVGEARLLRRERKLQPALAAFDELSERFPFNQWVRWARGDLLRSMGHAEAALDAMDSVLSAWPDYGPAQISKASMLIEARRFDEAGVVLESRETHTSEWSRSVLRAAILKSRGRWDEALLTLTHGLSRARLPRERRFLTSAIATLDMQRGRPEAAAHLAEAKAGEITNVIYFHALAATGRQQAKRLYERLIDSEADTQYRGIVIEIAQRFRLASGGPSYPPEWITEQEDKALIVEVS